MKIKPWIEALRLRTLPVSVAGVLAGCAVTLALDSFHWIQTIICMVFALIAQIVSNLANEYYDFKNGIDKKGREGFRRGVTEGDIKPEAMKHVMFFLMALDCLLGCTLIYWGGWWLIPVGILIVIAAFAYSAGPWPLSHHGLGDELVVIFYGIVPVAFTAYVQCCGLASEGLSMGEMWKMSCMVGLGVGLLADNVLTVNNIRDANDDAKVNKHTKAVMFGAGVMRMAYIVCYILGLALIWFAFRKVTPSWSWAGYAACAIWYAELAYALYKLHGKKLNKVLKFTSILLVVAIVWTLFCIIFMQLDIDNLISI